jgi:hypothetical protein
MLRIEGDVEMKWDGIPGCLSFLLDGEMRMKRGWDQEGTSNKLVRESE